jgi:hypothetical protein
MGVVVYPQASDSSEYTYGTDHGILGGKYRALPAVVNRARVFGNAVFDEAFDFGEQARAGELARNVVDFNLTTTGQAADRAGYELRRAALEAEDLVVTVPLNCGAELWDVVTVTDAVVGLASAKRRVLGLSFKHAAGEGRARARYELELVLGAA